MLSFSIKGKFSGVYSLTWSGVIFYRILGGQR